MKALLTIIPRDIGGKTVDTIEAREFYNLFQRAQQFPSWIGSCIQRFQFVPNVDYICIDTRPVGTKHGPTQRNYYMNLPAIQILAKSMRSQLGNDIYQWLVEYLEEQASPVQADVQNLRSPNLGSSKITETIQEVPRQQIDMLINLGSHKIGDDVIETVNARELHAFLESKQDFSTWVKKRIADYGFVENVDFVCFHKKMEANNATVHEYHLSLDMADELSMVERTPKGKQARQFFIKCKKIAQQALKQQLAAVQQGQLTQQREITQLKQVHQREVAELKYERRQDIKRYDDALLRMRDLAMEQMDRARVFELQVAKDGYSLEFASKRLGMSRNDLELCLHKLGWLARRTTLLNTSESFVEIGDVAGSYGYMVIDQQYSKGEWFDEPLVTELGMVELARLYDRSVIHHQ